VARSCLRARYKSATVPDRDLPVTGHGRNFNAAGLHSGRPAHRAAWFCTPARRQRQAQHHEDSHKGSDAFHRHLDPFDARPTQTVRLRSHQQKGTTMIDPRPDPGFTRVSDRVAARIAHLLTDELREARRDARRVDPDVLETMQRIDIAGVTFRNEIGRAAVPPPCPVYTAEGEWLGTPVAATALSVSPRRVCALIRADQLLAHRLDDTTWRIEPSSIAARKAHMLKTKRSRTR
jgi:hypothetical protein